jgi:hypothetical protein
MPCSRAGNSADAARILGPVREAQEALEAMEQPLKACYEAMQNTQAEQQQNNKKYSIVATSRFYSSSGQ